MGFWGIEVKQGQPYHYRLDNVQGRLHITQATLGTGSSTVKSIVQCSVGEKSPIFLCSLLPEKIESCPLNLEFEEDGLVAFSVIGTRSVHLSGFLEVDGRNSIRDDYESDSFGEDIGETETEESTDYDTEDEYDDDFIDDSDIEMFPPSPVPNSGVVIEEILDDEKAANGNNRSKRLKKKNQPTESEDNDITQRQIVVKSGSGVPVLESEDEDGFPISAPHKSTPIQKPESEAEAEEKMSQKTTRETKKRARDGGDHAKILKRDVNGIAQDGQPERGGNQPFDSSHPSTEVVPENDVKQKKRKKKKQQKEHTKEGKAPEAGTDKESDVLPASNEQVQKLTDEERLDIDADNGNRSEEKKRKKKKKKSKTQESGGDANMEQNVTTEGATNGSTMALEEEETEAKPSQVRTFPNGLVIEELAMGKPDGKRASPGKKVSVHYIGKLKKNGKVFDSNVGRAPFKFRLGVGQVIKGWDVGVNGMRIGDKRRLTIPPSMGYGAQGAGGKIPPNAWLVFDVELVDVR